MADRLRALYVRGNADAGTTIQKSPLGGGGPAIIIAVWINVAISALLVGLRAYAASRREGKWRWDFIWVTLSLITGTLGGILLTKSVTVGLGNHQSNLSVDNWFAVLRWGYYAVYMGTLSIAFSKFAVTALLLDVQRGTQVRLRRYSLWVMAIIFTITTLLELFLTAFQCRPLSKLYNVLEPGSCPFQTPARRISFVHAIIGGLTDVFLALFPITIVWDLQTSRRVKFGFCVLMALGIVPATASFVRYRLLHVIYAAQDFTYAEGLFMVWAVIEVGSLIILGSIPPLRPLFMRVVYGVKTLKSGEASRGGAATGANVSRHELKSRQKSGTEVSHHAVGDDVDDSASMRILVSHSYQVDTKTRARG